MPEREPTLTTTTDPGPFYEPLLRDIERGACCIQGLTPGAQSLWVSVRALVDPRPVVWVVDESIDLRGLASTTEQWLQILAPVVSRSAGPTPPVVTLPAYDRSPFLMLTTHPSIVKARLHAWSVLATRSEWILIIPVTALVRKAPPLDYFRELIFEFTPGMEIPRDFLQELLETYGYQSTDVLQQPGEYALRGAIVDYFPPDRDHPVRLEFLDETLEEIRLFDLETQRSLKRLGKVTVLPWVEFPLDRKGFEHLLEHARATLPEAQWDTEFRTALMEWSESGQFPGYEDYLPWFQSDLVAWPDRVGDVTWVLSDIGDLERAWNVAADHLREAARNALERGVPAPLPQSLLDMEGSKRIMDRRPWLLRSESSPFSEPAADIHHHTEEPRHFEGHIREFTREVADHLRRGGRCLISLRSRARAERFQALFRDYLQRGAALVAPQEVAGRLQEEPLVLTWGSLEFGFIWPVTGLWVLQEDHVFGRQPRLESRHEVPLERLQALDLAELKAGDYVVHREHGIGRFLGLHRLRYGSNSVEAATIEYAGGDRLYVPVDRLDTIQKYMGAGPGEPTLDRLGGRTWQAKKRRARKAVEGIVEELVKIYAQRQVARGFAFPVDDEYQEMFARSFSYELTPDQARAIREVLQDMTRPEPMDRLLCGDVGFGKTEVAMRAAFKAVNAGKQVAVLVPTTVLAFQHYLTFTQRFAEFPVRIATLSRLVPPREQRRILNAVKKGDVDIVIGTHRLLSKDVEFFDLGLVIIDEEQRFGVMQKERLKALRADVDVLSMTATPIPRTLQMALSGLMEISTIRTPPRDRLAVQTYVVHGSDDVIRTAIENELSRGGQVFFVHNQVPTLDRIAARVERLVPLARVLTAHGQMPARQLERVLLKFIRGEADVLITTTIIENGVDMPNVNTLIVNNAHRFGLAQLYQLRGRVGRSHRRAYAYLLVPPAAELEASARKRLAALKEFTELGSGFRLAALDLELRGAGELLGKRQHGHIAALGFDAYLEILKQAVAEIRKTPYQPPRTVTIQLPVAAEIPETYMPSERHRIYYYRTLARLTDLQGLQQIREELRDLYGPLPETVENLFRITRLRIMARRYGITEITARNGRLWFTLQPDTEDLHTWWVERIQSEPGIRFESPDRIGLDLRHVPAHPEAIQDWLERTALPS